MRRVSFMTHLASPILKSARCTTLITKQRPANSLGLRSASLIDEIDVSGTEIFLHRFVCPRSRFRGANIAINGTFTLHLELSGNYHHVTKHLLNDRLKNWLWNRIDGWKMIILAFPANVSLGGKNATIAANLFLKHSYSVEDEKRKKFLARSSEEYSRDNYERERTSSGSIELLLDSVISSVSDQKCSRHFLPYRVRLLLSIRLFESQKPYLRSVWSNFTVTHEHLQVTWKLKNLANERRTPD